jgi:hypothetical protein
MQILQTDNDIMQAIKKSEARNEALQELLSLCSELDTVNSEDLIYAINDAVDQVYEHHPHLER